MGLTVLLFAGLPPSFRSRPFDPRSSSPAPERCSGARRPHEGRNASLGSALTQRERVILESTVRVLSEQIAELDRTIGEAGEVGFGGSHKVVVDLKHAVLLSARRTPGK